MRHKGSVIFLGLADHFEGAEQPFPYGAVDAYRLAQHKLHIIYPGMIQSNVWMVLARTTFLAEADLGAWSLNIVDSKGEELGRIQIQPNEDRKLAGDEVAAKGEEIPLFIGGNEFSLVPFKIDSLVKEPGIYTIQSSYNGKNEVIGKVEFHYRKAPPLTPDQVRAIESDPNSVKAIRMELGCKKCPAKLRAYSGLDRSPRLEQQGWIWQSDLPEQFICECGSTNFSLEYLRESMHGILLKDLTVEPSNLSFVRRYGHQQVKEIVTKFSRLLDKERLEQPVQEFIEENPILLARFHAKRLFPKPNIVGRFQADFAVVDSRKQLWLIELEKPSLQLFKKDRHPTQALMHAYCQVTDWLEQYAKYPTAILDSLSLSVDDVVTVRGAVIAGRSRDVTHDVIQRHLRNPPYANIEFMTCDDLAADLLEISRNLA